MDHKLVDDHDCDFNISKVSRKQKILEINVRHFSCRIIKISHEDCVSMAT